MLILVTLVLLVCQGKIIKYTHPLSSEDKIKLIGDFGGRGGENSYSFKLKFLKFRNISQEEQELKLLIFNDKNWSQSLLYQSCDELVPRTVSSISLDPMKRSAWSKTITGSIYQDSPSKLYFVFAYCSFLPAENIKVKTELEVLNEDKSHLPLEADGIKSLYFYMAILYIALLGFNIKSMNTVGVKPVLLWMTISIILEALGLLLLCLHMYKYEENGYGSGFLETVGCICDTLSIFNLMFLFGMISYGWTIQYESFPDPDYYIPVLMIVGILNIFLGCLGRITDSGYSHLDLYNWSEILLMIFRCGVYGAFMSNLLSIRNDISNTLNTFKNKFILIGSLYSISRLVVMLGAFVNFIGPFSAISINLTVHWAIILWFSALVIDKTSSYSKSSILCEGILPTNKSHSL